MLEEEDLDILEGYIRGLALLDFKLSSSTYNSSNHHHYKHNPHPLINILNSSTILPYTINRHHQQQPATASMSPARRVLISVTSASATLFQGKETTGLFISEALHPFKVLSAAGFEVDLSSETGKYTPDWLSLQPDFLNGEDLEIWNDVNSDFRKKLDNMTKASEIDGSVYGVFYASAGHAALIDYPTARNLQKIAEQVYASGGIVSSVCHGPAIFANLLDTATNEPLIKGKTITGFTTEAENTMGIMAELRTFGSPMVEELAEQLGATCKSSPHNRLFANFEPTTNFALRQALLWYLG